MQSTEKARDAGENRAVLKKRNPDKGLRNQKVISHSDGGVSEPELRAVRRQRQVISHSDGRVSEHHFLPARVLSEVISHSDGEVSKLGLIAGGAERRRSTHEA